ncbi:cupin domain-containing protein [Kangiella shandongensis]|uniref:cupin domain-containing protein n=1 Tax=Kangiella shandongensis TaxID=2763258 RepID=UPI001CBBA5F1|nr:cupin domain-containing protein [Kangiella shandongensis]
MPNLKNTFAVIKPELEVDQIDVTPSVYSELDKNYNDFKDHQLVSIYEFSDDWGSWENHPKGDEIVVLVSGTVTFVFDNDGEYEEATLKDEGDFLVVPKNIWHTAKTKVPSKVLFITPGEDTQHK